MSPFLGEGAAVWGHLAMQKGFLLDRAAGAHKPFAKITQFAVGRQQKIQEYIFWMGSWDWISFCIEPLSAQEISSGAQGNPKEFCIVYFANLSIGYILGMTTLTNMDEFSENFQTAFAPPALISEKYVPFFFGRC